MLDTQSDLRTRLLDLDTAAVSDAMDSLGIGRALYGIEQRVPGLKIAGPAFTVQYQPLDPNEKGFKNAGNYIDQVPAGSVIVISNDGNTTCTNWGDILTTMAHAKGIAGTIINGSARDIGYVRKMRYPLYTKGVFMVSAKNRTGISATNVQVDFAGTPVVPGDWIFGDDNGVLVIPADHLEDVIRRAENVNATEEKIVEAIKSGVPLEKARVQFGYATPWERQPETPEKTPQDFISYWQSRVDFIDIHYHANPDTYTRRLSPIEAGQAYKDLRGAVLLKSHLGDTSAVAATCRAAGLPVFGSTALNAISGGLDRGVIERALCFYQSSVHCGRLVVDLPTVVQTAHRSALKRPFANPSAEALSQQIAPLSDENGALLPSVREVLEFCQGQDVVLTTGHANKRETFAVIDLCAKMGGIRLLLNQPANPIAGFTVNDLVLLGEADWLFVEQTALTYLLGYQDDADFYGVLARVPNLIYSSDLGQPTQMTAADWRAASAKWFDSAGLGPTRVADITLNTALRMLAP